MKRVPLSFRTHELLLSAGYKLTEDASRKHRRRTYIHDDDATRTCIADLARILAPAGWAVDPHKLRAFKHQESPEIIEVEPGGSGTTGHFLHHMRVLKNNNK
jgi:hypothetical protein